ncbi:MAG: hypothetical protein HY870_00315 [Chloroflexi bacterium]|nr:hypothetical protein [Chloroflexota bacterium]
MALLEFETCQVAQAAQHLLESDAPPDRSSGYRTKMSLLKARGFVAMTFLCSSWGNPHYLVGWRGATDVGAPRAMNLLME